MANNQRRMLYTKTWTSQQVGHLSIKARLLYVGMITLADDDGRLIGNPAYLRGQIFPYDADMTIDEVIFLKKEIESSDLIFVYKVKDFEYIEHPNWPEYQVIRADLYKPSKFPDRYGHVTKMLQRRNKNVIQVKLSKVKLSKDNNNPPTPLKKGGEETFSFNEEMKKLESSDKREFNIIALFMEEKQPDIKNRAQFNVFFKRHLRAAKQLIPFTNEQIIKAVNYAQKEYPSIWGLETIIKILTK